MSVMLSQPLTPSAWAVGSSHVSELTRNNTMLEDAWAEGASREGLPPSDWLKGVSVGLLFD